MAQKSRIENWTQLSDRRLVPNWCVRIQGQRVFPHSRRPGEVGKVLHSYDGQIYPENRYKSRASARGSQRLTTTDKGSYQYNKFFCFIVTNTSTIYAKVPSLHHSCLLNELSNIKRFRAQLSEFLSSKLPPITGGWTS